MDPDLPGPDAAEPQPAASGPISAATAWERLETALAGLEAALEAQKGHAEGGIAELRRELDEMKAENTRLAGLLKAERTRVQRLEDLTSAVSGRVDSAIGELESILEP